MPRQKQSHDAGAVDARAQLLQGIPVEEHTVQLEGISTAVLEGGDGPPLLLLHGPGETAVNWRWVIPELVATHHVIAPDLPAHGDTAAAEGTSDERTVLGWLDALIDATCPQPPVLVGHALGGAIGLRYASRFANRLQRVVVEDSLGVGRFRPAPRFAVRLAAFFSRPNERTFEGFMSQCAFDLGRLQGSMGPRQWEVFRAYNVALARSPNAKAAGRMLRRVGLPKLPDQRLASITTPVSMIWGRDDRAVRLRTAQAASRRFGWPLHVIDEAADDPARDRPTEFVEALRAALTDPAPGT